MTVRVLLGPRTDWFTATRPGILATGRCVVTTLRSRVGIRLDGSALLRRISAERRSEGVVLGAVQVPAAGTPVIFLADHPAMGGYSVIGVVHPDDLPLAPRPGHTGAVQPCAFRFHPVYKEGPRLTVVGGGPLLHPPSKGSVRTGAPVTRRSR
ncbi:hypothetical protein DKT69_22550 [Micromonospora sicca]|uniref:Carboxyltransferase domain-containing protein n=1 Tax=Micromonospora sicca TaxID=2202420 RepID=A0A317DDJ8_9ACTN|nr:hypothetical protein [Micromonospora sp. ATA51]PWR12909.1 hypothetical protein DKT69_22550 [Micromonospora sp. 4G51]